MFGRRFTYAESASWLASQLCKGVVVMTPLSATGCSRRFQAVMAVVRGDPTTRLTAPLLVQLSCL